jgi:hypothetical protein
MRNRARPSTRRQHERRQIGDNMLLPQLRQMTFAVSDIRAIVECEPQFGHSERSSNRRRQYTQR